MDSITIITEHPVEGTSQPIIAKSNILSMSEYLKNSVIEGTVTIPIEASVRGHIMKIIIDYCEHYLSRPDLSDDSEWFLSEFSSSWDIATTFRVAVASEFLGISPLLTNTLGKVRKTLISVKIADLKELLSFKEDLPKEDRIV